MTLQEIFDRVAAHLLKQNEQSISPNGLCAYFSGTLRCAVGCLIPEAVYSPDIEGPGIHSVKIRKILKQAGVLSVTRERQRKVRFLHDLQFVHDAHHPNEWPRALHNVARRFYLQSSVLS